eukprot:439035-Prorocentrum_minimum.AAC.2
MTKMKMKISPGCRAHPRRSRRKAQKAHLSASRAKRIHKRKTVRVTRAFSHPSPTTGGTPLPPQATTAGRRGMGANSHAGR